MRARGLLVVAFLGGLGSQASADANSLNDPLGPRSLAMGESLRADATGVSATTLNPAGLALSSELLFEGAFGHRPGDGANVVNVAACDSTVPLPACYYYRYINADPQIGGMSYSRRVHEVGISASRTIAPTVAIGVTGRYFDYNSDLMGEEDSDGFQFDAGTVVRPSQMVSVAVVGYNLIGDDSAQYPRAIGTGLALQPSPTLTLGLDALWDLELPEGQSAGRYGGGVEYFFRSGDLQTGYPMRAGAVHDVGLGTYLTAGLGLQTAKLGLDIGARKQVEGGDELMIQAGLRIYGPRQEMGALPQY
jgi:hypothetical protein